MSLVIRAGYTVGCVGRVTELHARFYSRHANFGLAFEARVAREMAAFLERYQAGHDGIWLAFEGDEIQGCVAIEGASSEGQAAHLRWFITSDETRGSGIGSQLLASALAHCDRLGFEVIGLHTFAGLDAARHLYEKNGFRLVHQQLGSKWSTEVQEQRFERRKAWD